MTESRLNLLVALPAEAKAVNRILGLRRRQPDDELPLYVGEHLALTISGPGSRAAARAVRFLARINPNPQAHWLNIGIAGHSELPLGQALLANQVQADHHHETWRLTPPGGLPCRCGRVQTVSRPRADYDPALTYDMEAAGFVAAALEVAARERVQVLKIISDNHQNPLSGINGKMVKRLIEGQSNLIQQLVRELIHRHD